MTAARYRKPCLTRWSWVVDRSCQAHLEHQPAEAPNASTTPRQIRWHLSRALPRCFQDLLIGQPATPGVLLRESRGKRRNDQARRRFAPPSNASARPPMASRSVCHHSSIYLRVKSQRSAHAAIWHPTRRLLEARRGRRWHIVASNGIGLIFCATCVLAGHKFAPKLTLLGIVVFVTHYATNRFLVGGTTPTRLRRLLRIWQLHVIPRQDLVWICGGNHE